jgi:transposase
MKRKVFSREFKLEAVKLVVDRGVACAQVARDLDIGQNVISRWVREAKADKAQAFPGRGVMKPEDAEIARLKRELAKTRAERDILKKTIGFFAKEPT